MKYRTYSFSAEFLKAFYAPGEHSYGAYLVENGIPADAELINISHGWPNVIRLLFRSESFDETPEGVPIPEASITVTNKPS